MSDDVWFLLSVALVASMTLLFAAWVVGRRMNNATVGDVAWAFGFTIVGAIFFVIGTGAPTRRSLIAGMLVLWSLRLGIHLWMRAARGEGSSRYAALRTRFPEHTWLMLFGFFELQAVLLTVLCVPFALAASNPTPGLSAVEWAGAALWLVALLGETIADWQLQRFHRRPENQGRVCRTGLWRLSRHPNAFFQWLVWVAFFLFALGTPHGWIAICAPLLVLHSLAGDIQVTEAAMERSHGDAYREYRRTTSAFAPWFSSVFIAK